MNIQAHYLDKVIKMFQYANQEVGGILGIRADEIVCHHRDSAGQTTAGSYRPSTQNLAEAIMWFAQVYHCDDFCFVHSHPALYRELSSADLLFARSFLKLNPGREYIHMGLVVDGSFLLYRISAGASDAAAIPVPVNACHSV